LPTLRLPHIPSVIVISCSYVQEMLLATGTQNIVFKFLQKVPKKIKNCPKICTVLYSSAGKTAVFS